MSETVHFRITGEFITQHSRTLWAEGNYAGAFKALDCLMGITREQQEQILFGSRKLTGENEVSLVEDDWDPKGEFAGCFYPSLVEALFLGNGDRQAEILMHRRTRLYRRLYDHFHETDFMGHRRLRGRIYDQGVEDLGEEEAQKIFNEVMEAWTGSRARYDEGRYASFADPEEGEADPLTALYAQAREDMVSRAVELGVDPEVIPDVDAMKDRGYGKEPKKDPKMESKCGWLLPNGTYYGCGSMEHIGLAYELLKDKHPQVANESSDAEQFAETYGWVKITLGIGGFHVMCKKKVTQKQLDRLFDYCEVHKKNYEKVTQLLSK